MTGVPPQVARRLATFASELLLSEYDSRLVLDPDNPELSFERAELLQAMGRADEAKRAYRRILARHPAHFRALSNLSALLHEGGSNRAARFALALLDARHPQRTRAPAAPAPALVPSRRGTRSPARVLLLASNLQSNAPTAQYLYDDAFLISEIVVEDHAADVSLPPHHVVFNTIGDADKSPAALERAAAIVRRTGAPVINDPAAVSATGRVANARRLGGIPGVIAPASALFARRQLQGREAEAALRAAGISWPLLLRTPGFHTGRHFLRVTDPERLAFALAELPGDDILALQYLDARGPDGRFRKFRVMFVDGRLYPLHLAISDDWKVHYFSADMTENAEHRALDADFLEDMSGVLGTAAIAALERVRDVVRLDYAGIDFGLDPSGRILLFEANATMIAPPPPPDERWAYRREAVERILSAARAMVRRRAAARSGLR